jgi:DNA modification methylase
METNIENLHIKIRELEKQVAHLNAQLKKKRFGLTWIDVPEAFDKESEDKIPVLEEVPEKEIHNHDGKPTHILIEGDNYHALQCLRYTHSNNIDVMYFDPPYNTGGDGFTYRDKRYLTEYPDGTTIPKNHPLRHSAWLSFMKKRLAIAHELLKDEGVLFISIDENESVYLTELCNNIFGANNYIATLIWQKRKGGGNDSAYIAVDHEFVLVYMKKKPEKMKWRVGYSEEYLKRYNLEDDIGKYYYDTLSRPGLNNPIIYDVECPDGSIIKNGTWQMSEKEFLLAKDTGDIKFVENSSGGYTVLHKVRMPEGRVFRSIITNVTNKNAADEMEMIFGSGKAFSNPKPIRLVEQLLELPSLKKGAVVLDIFAGSGTTLHSSLLYDMKNNLNLQCILVQLPEKTWEVKNGNKTAKEGCEVAFKLGYDNIAEMTYHRCACAINGYVSPVSKSEVIYQERINLTKLSKGKEIVDKTKRIKENNLDKYADLKIKLENDWLTVSGKVKEKQRIDGFGGSLKYYRTSFVGKNPPKRATDDDSLNLAKKAGCLLSLAENTLYEQTTTDYYQIFADEINKWTCIYFQEDYSRIEEFKQKVKELDGKKIVYIFCWTDGAEFAAEFDFIKDVEVKSIPRPILDIYKSLNV